ncbi:hypothetical protein [Leifsonia sp. Leaf264]|uniref:hypothetical protein n=1 Tax=Leifsonia sp. Leaf264 TaxID=1736314 RepID=UPI0006FF1337|nr:hypothetical protein [Leifsonia sp. Leaf264]KQO98609.1 hypothetical protein ASF30_11140 [Leifsonia sp. Leaf264]
MSAFAEVTINCDGPALSHRAPNLPSDLGGCPGWFQSDTARTGEARRQAKRAGWRTERVDGRTYDICFAHHPEGNPS